MDFHDKGTSQYQVLTLTFNFYYEGHYFRVRSKLVLCIITHPISVVFVHYSTSDALSAQMLILGNGLRRHCLLLQYSCMGVLTGWWRSTQAIHCTLQPLHANVSLDSVSAVVVRSSLPALIPLTEAAAFDEISHILRCSFWSQRKAETSPASSINHTCWHIQLGESLIVSNKWGPHLSLPLLLVTVTQCLLPVYKPTDHLLTVCYVCHLNVALT